MVYHSKTKDWMVWRGIWEADKFIGDGSGITNLPVGTETDPIWNAQSSAFIQTELDPTFQGASAAITASLALIDPHIADTTNPHSVLLDQLGNPDGDKSFTMSNKLLGFRYTAPTPAGEFEGAFEIEATGGFTGNLLHVHQHTGNPGEVHMVHLEAEDSDVLPLCSIHASGRQLQLAHTSEVTFCNFTVDASDNLTMQPSGSGVIKIGANQIVDEGTTNYVTLTDNSMADALHRHSELSASDGTPDASLQVDASGRVRISTDLIVDSDLLFVDVAGNVGVGIGTETPGEMLDVVGNAEINGNIIVTGTVDGVDIAAASSALVAHSGDGTIHFTSNALHASLALVDPHIADDTIHFTSGAIHTSLALVDSIIASQATISGDLDTTIASLAVVEGEVDANTASAALIDGLVASTALVDPHIADASDPHGSTLTQTTITNTTINTTSGAMTADNDASGAAIFRNVLVGTEASTALTASDCPQGTIYLKYT